MIGEKWKWVKQKTRPGARGTKPGGRTLSSEELSGDVQSLTPHNDNLLAVQQLLGHRGSQASEKMPLAIDDDLQQPPGFR